MIGLLEMLLLLFGVPSVVVGILAYYRKHQQRIDRAERAALMEVSLDAEKWGDQEHHDELRLRSIR